MPDPPTTPACVAYNHELDPGSYGYQPSLGWGITFTIVFTFIAIAQTVHTFRNRALWMGLFVVGAGLETLGWISRTVGYECPYSRALFLMQTSTLIMGKLS